MQKGRVLRFKSFGVFEFLQKNSILLICLLFLIIGIFLGNFYYNHTENLGNYFKDYIAEFVEIRSNSSFLQILWSSFCEFSAVLFFLFFLGASLFGVVTLPISMLLRGFFQGAISSVLYSEYGLKGIAFNAVVFIPATLGFVIVMLLAGRESVKFSLKISRLTLSSSMPQNLSNDFREYSIKYLIFLAFTFASSLLDAIITSGLVKNITL
jgi:stage II sporulation protein M